jgi:hypothetical protein
MPSGPKLNESMRESGMAPRRTFALLPVAGILLATLGFLVPWQACGLCGGAAAREPKRAFGWTCPRCRDEPRLSLWTVLTRRRPAPPVERLAQAMLPGGLRGDYLRRLDDLLDHAGAKDEPDRGYHFYQGWFLPTDAGGRLVLLMFSADPQTLPAGARCLLFDFDGALLDRLDVDAEPSLSRLELDVPEDGRPDTALFTLIAYGRVARPSPNLHVRRDRRGEKLPPEELGGSGRKAGIGLQGDRFVLR